MAGIHSRALWLEVLRPLGAFPKSRSALSGRTVKSWLFLVIAALFLGGAPMGCQNPGASSEKGAVAALSQLVIPSSCELAGKVLHEDSAKPAANEAVIVRNVDKNEVVHETTTDMDGNYKLPKLSPGNYSVVFAGRVQADIRVVSGEKPQMELLNISIPAEALSTPNKIPQAVEGESQHQSGKK